MRTVVLYLFFSVIFSMTAQAQYLQLSETSGEIGVFQGTASYRGDIAPGNYKWNPSYGGFYKKLVNDYIGIRLSYENITLEGNDNSSFDMYAMQRKFDFYRNFEEISLTTELYFLKFIDGNKHFRFSPYLSFGAGAIKSKTSKSDMNESGFPNTQDTITIVYPFNFGFKYNVIGPFNVFAEATYRFTNSDNIDHLSDEGRTGYNSIPFYQGSASGKDQYFSFKVGLSYNLLKIYGPDKQFNEKKKSIFGAEESSDKTSTKKSFFKFFKRN